MILRGDPVTRYRKIVIIRRWPSLYCWHGIVCHGRYLFTVLEFFLSFFFVHNKHVNHRIISQLTAVVATASPSSTAGDQHCRYSPFNHSHTAGTVLVDCVSGALTHFQFDSNLASLVEDIVTAVKVNSPHQRSYCFIRVYSFSPN